jgi:GTPase SAR1 family protein
MAASERGRWPEPIDAFPREERYLKCVVLGDGAVGKTSLCATLLTGQFPSPEEYLPNAREPADVQLENSKGEYHVDSQPWKIHLVDTAGAEDYWRLRPLVYPGTHCFLLCFSLAKRCSLDSIMREGPPPSMHRGRSCGWAREVRYLYPPSRGFDLPFILVGTKRDLRDASPDTKDFVSREEGSEAATQLGAMYVEVSSLQQEGADELLGNVVRRCSNGHMLRRGRADVPVREQQGDDHLWGPSAARGMKQKKRCTIM